MQQQPTTNTPVTVRITRYKVLRGRPNGTETATVPATYITRQADHTHLVVLLEPALCYPAGHKIAIQDNNLVISTETAAQLLPEAMLITGNAETKEIHINGKQLRPEPSQQVWNHSPDGFNWGYAGSGPAQLALAILLKYWPKNFAQTYYHDFKFKTIAALPGGKNFAETLNLRAIMADILKARTTTA